MKKILLLIAAAMMAIVAGAQEVRTTKMDMELHRLLQGSTNATNSARRIQGQQNDTVTVIAVMKVGAAMPKAALKAIGIRVENEIGRFVCLRVPVGSIAKLDGLDDFEQFEMDRASNVTNINSQKAMKADVIKDEAKAMDEGLAQQYSGKGVIVGVYDQGIDFNHNNFRDPETHQTRILEARVYSNTTTPVKVANTEEDVKALTTDANTTSHGTHTASIAAGSYDGLYVGTADTARYSGYRGVAYEADLVLCGSSELLDSHQMDALSRMAEIAESEGKPLVVNLSIGQNYGWMDGKTAICKFYDLFTDHGNRPGRIVVLAAGNEGDFNNTCVKVLMPEENEFGILLPKTTKLNSTTQQNEACVKARVKVFMKEPNVQLEGAGVFYWNGESLTGKDNSEAKICDSNHDNRYYYEYIIEGPINSEQDEYVLKVKGNKTDYSEVRVFVENYNYDTKQYESCNVATNCEIGVPFPLTEMNGASSINTLTCTNSVLSVGAWQVTNVFRGYNGKKYKYTTGDEDGNIACFSSWVECDDNGVARPDVAAPGVAVMSGYNCYDKTKWDQTTSQPLTLAVAGWADEQWLEGHTSLMGVHIGTSMACPNVAGVIALWLQADPTLTVNRVREIIKATADNDEMTAAAGNRFGAGKLNALAGLKMIALKDVNVTSAGYATFYAAHNMLVPEGVKVYAPQLSADGTKLLMGLPLEAGTVLPAHTGVIVAAEASKYQFASTDKAAAEVTSCLTGTVVDAPVSAFEGQILSLARVDGEVGFYRYTGSTVAANKAFLLLPKGASAARELAFDFEEATTGIVAANEVPQQRGIYNLNGQRVDKPRRGGVYLVNGKLIAPR